MPNNKINLTPKDFSFICPLSIDELTPIEGGYYCDSCEKKVYDVSHMSKDELTTLQKKTKDLCVSFQKVTTVAVALSTSAWVVADDNVTQVPFSASNTQTNKIKHKMGKPIKRTSKKNTFILGKRKVIPQDKNETNTTNTLAPPIKHNVELF